VLLIGLVSLCGCLVHALNPAGWLDQAIDAFASQWPHLSYFSITWNIRSLLAAVLASLACGAVGSLVVGNRMAFFSDALAHCAFAGVALGFLLAFLSGIRDEQGFWQLVMPIMVVFGTLVGLGIAWVRDQTTLASDTVIGVFFAGAIGLAAVLRKLIRDPRLFRMEEFLFGDPINVTSADILLLLLLLLLTLGVLVVLYNQLVFASFNPSLARSRRVPVRLCSYVFIILLALIVNVCLRTVGALLINAMLVVPAATAAILSRNLRHMFWWTLGLCLAVTVAGHWISWTFRLDGGRIQLGISGSTVVLSVVLFFLSMLVVALARGAGMPVVARMRRGSEKPAA
jgi:zinc transport system permease protein